MSILKSEDVACKVQSWLSPPLCSFLTSRMFCLHPPSLFFCLVVFIVSPFISYLGFGERIAWTSLVSRPDYTTDKMTQFVRPTQRTHGAVYALTTDIQP